jgi:hypothetical protein
MGADGEAREAKEPLLDIFRRASSKKVVWCEAVEGLANARARMEQIALLTPGDYFVFSRRGLRDASARTCPPADRARGQNIESGVCYPPQHCQWGSMRFNVRAWAIRRF